MPKKLMIPIHGVLEHKFTPAEPWQFYRADDPKALEVYATDAGKVQDTDWNQNQGRVLVIQHDGYQSVYAGMDAIYHNYPDPVTKGLVVAKAGKSGKKTEVVGLRFQLRVPRLGTDGRQLVGADGEPLWNYLDPALFLGVKPPKPKAAPKPADLAKVWAKIKAGIDRFRAGRAKRGGGGGRERGGRGR